MFGISFSEIILIFIIALLVLGPKQLPPIIYKTRELMLALKHLSTNIKNEVYEQSGFNELKASKNLLISGYQDIKHSILTNESINNAAYSIKEPEQMELEFYKDPELF